MLAQNDDGPVGPVNSYIEFTPAAAIRRATIKVTAKSRNDRGTFQIQVATTRPDLTARPPPAPPGPGTAPAPCSAGTVDADGDPSTPCTACDIGSYAPAGASECAQCVAGKADKDSDPATPCEDCAVGTFAGAGASTCQACSTCASGTKVSSSCTTSSDISCMACSSGQYRAGDTTTARSCDSCSTCESGKKVSSRCSSSADVVCAACAAGQYRSGNTADRTTCFLCDPGKFANIPGRPFCDTCGPGFFSGEAAQSCETCSAGQFSSAEAASCDDCAVGTADTDSSHLTPCSTCQPGSYAPGGTTTCIQCEQGAADLDEDPTTECEQCPAGFTSAHDSASVSCKVECTAEQRPDCNGLCTNVAWVGDGFCDDPYEGHHLNCADLDFDGGDCTVVDADDEFAVDCLGHRAPLSWVGDGACDNGVYEHNGKWINFNCAEAGFDGGDCPGGLSHMECLNLIRDLDHCEAEGGGNDCAADPCVQAIEALASGWNQCETLLGLSRNILREFQLVCGACSPYPILEICGTSPSTILTPVHLLSL